MTKIFDFLDSLDPNLGAVYSANNLVLMTDKEYSNRLEQIRTLTTENRRLQQKVNQLETNRDEAIEHCHKRLGFLENCVGGDEELIHTQIIVHREYLEILERGKE